VAGLKDYRDRVAIVTGGASGIGRALCGLLAGRGAVVIVTDVNEVECRKAAAEMGGRARGVFLDVRDAAAVEKLVGEVAAEFGRLDFMFNNAGIIVLGELRDSTLEHWRLIADVNLNGVIYGTMAAYAVMAKQGFGHIVNVGSMTGLIPAPAMALYAATKYGVVGFSNSLREEAASLGVKVSVVCPGLVRTNIPEGTTFVRIPKEKHLARLPWKWMMDPESAGRAILRGMERNRAVIVFPWHSRLTWWCYRWAPFLLKPVLGGMVNYFRSIRTEK